MTEPLSLRRELARKAIHLTSTAVPVAYALGMPRRLVVGALALAVVIAFAVELLRARHARTRALFGRTAGALLRAHEHQRVSGATWLALALLAAAALLPRALAVASMWAVCVGDAAGALVGRAVGRHRVTRASSKTLEGSAACFAAAALGALLVARLSLAASLVCGSAAALAEFPSRPLDDNVRIVVTVGGCLLAWRAFTSAIGA